MKRKKKNKQIKSLDEVIKLILNGTIVYCNTTEKHRENKNDWDCRYAIATLPDGEKKVMKSNWFETTKWGAYSNDISFEEIAGIWFIKEK